VPTGLSQPCILNGDFKDIKNYFWIPKLNYVDPLLDWAEKIDKKWVSSFFFAVEIFFWGSISMLPVQVSSGQC
jgi:hypothetical protein